MIAVCLLLLLTLFGLAATGAVPQEEGLQVRIEALPVGGSAARDNGGIALHREDGGSVVDSLLRFELPPPGDDGARWVVRVERDPVHEIWLRRGDWRSPTLRFFSPDGSEGVLPSSYLFPLPQDWQGPIEIELHATGKVRGAMLPRVMRQAQATRLEQYGVAASATIYASLFTIGLLALALFWAARDRLFLGLFAYLLATLLTLSAVNGHLYQLPLLRAYAFWREQGLLALALLLAASWLQMLFQYASTAPGPRRWKRTIDIASLALVALAALCLLNLPGASPLLLRMKLLLFACAIVLGLLLLVDAGRRRIQMAWPLAAMTLPVLAGVVLVDQSARGQLFDTIMVRYGYQMGMVVAAAILAVGLISRIGEYRHQRDQELLARTDTERRMQREAARSALAAELQTQLRSLPVADIQWTAFRLMLDRLKPLLPVERCVVASWGYHGHDTLLVDPAGQAQELEASLRRRQLELKRQAVAGIALQQPVTSAQQAAIVATEAVVPLQLRLPAWGVLLLQRAGADGFTTEELTLADDFARLALLHIDQSVAAIALRRSAELDALTGSLNRRTIDQWLARTFVEASRDRQPVSILFIDLDHFKSINDRHGHACGDFCLRNVALALHGALQEGDLFGRYGGEEFIAILPGRAAAAARETAERLRMAVEALRPPWNGLALRLTVSVGVATRLDHEETPDATLERADRALYAAKASGRNCVRVAPAVFR
ncbi:MAG TPA: GGDEF domain-containing protein [Luteimonas sp.]|nr:GGDEF domain-containing protein [Luteimonas sp.]HRP72739.1 GGDEF domain-containing protein [Luteimonas sp.]